MGIAVLPSLSVLRVCSLIVLRHDRRRKACRHGNPLLRTPRRRGPQGSARDREGLAKPAERGGGVAAGPGLQADDAGVADIGQRGGDGGVVDLAGPRLAPTGDVRDLDLPDPVDAVAEELDEVPLPICAW
jgi:hypothetical protein